MDGSVIIVSQVYHVTATPKHRENGAQTCAVKYFRRNSQSVTLTQSSSSSAASAAALNPLLAEVDLLRFVSSLELSPTCALTPTVVFACDTFFGMTPVGRHFLVDPATGAAVDSSSSSATGALALGEKIAVRLPHRRHIFELMRLLMNLHKNGVFHRDIRPSNILLVEAASVRVAGSVAANSSLSTAFSSSKAESVVIPLASSSSSSVFATAAVSTSLSASAASSATSASDFAAGAAPSRCCTRLMVTDFGASIMCRAVAARMTTPQNSEAKSKLKSKSKSQAQSHVGVGLLVSDPLPYLGAFTQASVSVLNHLAGLPATADASIIGAISPSSACASASVSASARMSLDDSSHLSAAPYAFTAADELESVVHTLFTLIHPQLIRDALAEWIQRCPRSRAHAAALASFWQQSMRAGAWRDAVDAARRVDYAAVAETLCRVLPGDVFWHDDDGNRAEWGGASEVEWAAASIAAIGEEQRALFPGWFQ